LSRIVVTRPPAHFLHLGINPSWDGDGAFEKALIEEKLNKAKDWLRYAPHCWLIYTAKNPTHWANVLRGERALNGKMTFFICEVNLQDKSGWLYESAWKWINKQRGTATDNAEL
jgi:hypothetical protein